VLREAPLPVELRKVRVVLGGQAGFFFFCLIINGLVIENFSCQQ
jgi:hypothetical protein